MSTNHNRIKVADLEKNESDKILLTNLNGELEFKDINQISYNALDYNLTNKALDARQGKALKDLIDNINGVLASDNVNLDTVQKLADAIETVQTSLNSILVNDLTTGGTTKALTAEMGKLLQTNKVDKVVGERLINAAEITKLSGLSNTNITTTVKIILSSVLATQNVAGFVAYINALNPVLVVGNNEIVKYTTSDTGRTFELNLRGRSFGLGQPAIVAANVTETTEFLNKDVRLSNYPNTRNDGQIPTNKVLGTDANGNLKLYTIATLPAPNLREISPNFYLPSTTGNIIIKGSFFTPTMTVSITGQTVNYITFISDNEVHVNVTTGVAEGAFSVTLNNGLSATFNNVLLIVLGTITKPQTSDFTILSGNPDISTEGEVKLNLYNIPCAVSFFTIPMNENFRVYFTLSRSPLGATIGSSAEPAVSLISASDKSKKFSAQIYLNGADTNSHIHAYQSSTGYTYGNQVGLLEGGVIIKNSPPTFYFERINGEYRIRDYNTNILFTDTFIGELQIRVDIRLIDITNLRYVKLI